MTDSKSMPSSTQCYKRKRNTVPSWMNLQEAHSTFLSIDPENGVSKSTFILKNRESRFKYSSKGLESKVQR